MDLDKYDPTPTHYFCKLLEDKGLMHQYLTQNIDNLEEKAGFDLKKICQAHGANFGATCSKCGKVNDRSKLEAAFKVSEVMRCECGGPVKPDITFFGEDLPAVFETSRMKL